ncbi:MAG TPA: Mur ligase family protein [Rubricoccaceae bacterium]|nr:Mur ligase family protein [Rubricoccaceae bacterium]
MRHLEDFPDAHLRIFDRPPPPDPSAVKSVYLVGICGKGMGALAELLVQAGYAVRGSDEAAYPPMSTRLAEAGIPVDEGFSAENLARARPDLVVVGNAAVPTHPEATYARERGLVQLSFPEALAHFFLRGRRSLVVAGTHGKTTTTGMLVHVFREAGLDPGFLVGGVLAGLGATAAVGSGPHFIVEGDEYDAAYFDKRPKMLHYRPTSAVVTSMEFDHADIYADWDDYREAFVTFAGLVSEGGLLALHGDDPEVRALAAHSGGRVHFYGLEGHDDSVSARDLRAGEGGQRFTLVQGGEALGEVFLPLGGRYNVLNALAACALALDEGLGFEAIAGGLATFRGMRRRQEVAGEAAGVLVVDDFAHHPTAVAGTVEGVRERWRDRLRSGRLVAVFEPRSNSSRRKVFEARYGEAFDAADRVFLSTPPLRHNDDAADFLDPEAVAARVAARGVPASAHPGAAELLGPLLDTLRPGDLVLVMSNGSFDGLVGKLLAALRERENAPVTP